MFQLQFENKATIILLRERFFSDHIFLAPSKLSAICGLNKWCTQEEAASDLLGQYSGRLKFSSGFLEPTMALLFLEYAPGRLRDKLTLVESARTVQDLQKAVEGMRGHSHIDPRSRGDAAICDALIEATLFADSDEELETLEVPPETLEVPPESLPEGMPTVEEITARSAHTGECTDIGIAREEADLLSAGVSEGSQKNYREEFLGDFNVRMSGYIDGIRPHKKYPQGIIVESKRRMRNFRGVPLEEQVQMEAYMELQRLANPDLPAPGYCEHIENYEDMATRTKYKSNPNLRHRIRRGLHDFMIRLAAMFAENPDVIPVHQGRVELPQRSECDEILEKYRQEVFPDPYKMTRVCPLKLF